MLNVLIQKGRTFIEKGRRVKSRGIALTHKDQGFSANNRYISLLAKSDVDPNTLTVEMMKSLEQVQLRVSMQEFLRRFFDMWHDDAELLTKVLGFQTESEYNMEEKADQMDDWDKDWNERHQKYINEKVESFELIKSAKEGKELTLPEQFKVFQVRKAFEEGCEDLELTFAEAKDSGVSPPPAPTPADPEVPAAPAAPAPQAPPQPKAPSLEQQDLNKTKEKPVDKPETQAFDITKSKEFLDLQAELEVIKAAAAEKDRKAEEIIKAHEAARREVLVNKASGMAFIAEDQRDPIVEVLMKSADNALVLGLLEKAQAALVAKDAEIAEVKKSFADGKEVGTDGELNKAATGELTAQQKLDEIIKARATAKADK